MKCFEAKFTGASPVLMLFMDTLLAFFLRTDYCRIIVTDNDDNNKKKYINDIQSRPAFPQSVALHLVAKYYNFYKDNNCICLQF